MTVPSYPKWHDLVAGAAAGLGARAITAPLDLLKIRRQLSPPIASAGAKAKAVSEWNLPGQLLAIARKEGGAAALFRGNVAASYLWMGYNVAQFGLYGRTSELLLGMYMARAGPGADPAAAAPAVSFASGAVAGLCATLVTYPFDLCRTVFAARGVDVRLPVPASNVTCSDRTTEELASARRGRDTAGRPPRTMLEFARELHRQRGVSGFFAGAAPGLLQIVPYMGINFMLHDVLVAKLGRSGTGGSGASGLAGMAAGVVSKLLVFPMDTVKKRLQAEAFWGPRPGGGGPEGISSRYDSKPPPSAGLGSTGTPEERRVVGAVNRRLVNKPSSLGGAPYGGMVDCFVRIARNEGAAAFYKGIFPSLVKSSVSTGASFWLFTLTRNLLRSMYDGKLKIA